MSINLEIMTTGMAAADANGERHAADSLADVQDYSVDLRAIHFESGEVEVLFERDELTANQAELIHFELERLFPQADSEEVPL
jgi:hypothetical protein